jgi:hypothetical protein
LSSVASVSGWLEKKLSALKRIEVGVPSFSFGPLLAAEAVWFFSSFFRIWLLLSGAPFSGGVGIVCGKEGRIETITSWIFRERLVFWRGSVFFTRRFGRVSLKLKLGLCE